MESLVSGLRFLCTHGPDDEVFTIDDSDAVVPMMWPWPLFPCLLVVMGSGVSVLKIEGDRGHTRKARGGFTRIGGTACGGATFLGLSQLVTSAKSFDEALNLAKQGDAKRVNKLVSDIYGKEGSAVLGLPGDLTAAYFGKLISADGVKPPPVDEADLAAAVLAMVVQSTVGLAVALSKQPHIVNGAARSSRDAGTNSENLVGTLNSIGSMRRTVSSDSPGSLGCRDHRVPVFFAGGFLARNTMAQQIIGRTFRKLTGSQALFLKHSDFLGALGAVGSTM
jgi:type II pantothenate kinase